ncbi:hypothetical protein [Litoreibacter roseus]|uniref:Uncharacterized protein n=1 Tax=Litoreibacter roseus TaxID=2601869 RepID=A0A6N6JH25_9RHOB|nr:hypothetical protein [Litoreibacter roseus]GFE64689.1 hypothetical protein KIN_17630 [Litoreibacter roseus]
MTFITNVGGVAAKIDENDRYATENTVPSRLILGRLLGQEQGAPEFVDFYIAEMRKVTNVVDQIPAEDRPMVGVENAAG